MDSENRIALHSTPARSNPRTTLFTVTEGSKSHFLVFWNSIPPQMRLLTVC